MYNFKLEYTSSSSTLRVDILEKVNAFYIQELYKNSFAYEYLKQRGINDSTIEKFALGYASSSSEQFKFFKNANFNNKDFNNILHSIFNSLKRKSQNLKQVEHNF